MNMHLAVDYLSEGALVESASYVFGPVLKLLRSVGYTDGKNLDAASYDWRIPVSTCEALLNIITLNILVRAVIKTAKCT